MSLKEVYARSTIDELKRNIKVNKAMLNEGNINPESWRQKWLEEIKGFKWAICGFKKIIVSGFQKCCLWTTEGRARQLLYYCLIFSITPPPRPKARLLLF